MKIQRGPRHIFNRLLDFLERNESVVLSTIIEAQGSTPQVPGASALFSQTGLMFGTVGGGILEAEVEAVSAQALKTEDSLCRTFDLDAGLDSEDGAICGGRITLLIDGSPDKHKPAFGRLVQSLSQKHSGLLITCIDDITGEKVAVHRAWLERKAGRFDVQGIPFPILPLELETAFKQRLPVLLKAKKELVSDTEKPLIFIEPVFPLPQLVIAGAGHIGQALAHLGHLLDFEVTVIDDRSEFACQDYLPDADRIIVDDIGKAVGNFPVSPDTFVVIVTRGHRHDSEVLRACIHSQAAYIGMIGSRTKIKRMRQQFVEQGWATAEQFDRVHAPVGLAINSETVQEIAISIASQLVLIRSQIQKEQETR